MIRLDSTRKLRAYLAGAVAANEPQALVSYSDKSTSAYSGALAPSSLAGSTPADICGSPASGTVRDIDYLSINNRDTSPVILTLEIYDGATQTRILTTTLDAGDVLSYTHGSGFAVHDSAGALKTKAQSAGGQYFDFSPISAPAYQEGRVWYDTDENALSYYSDINGSSLQIGLEQWVRVRNSTGSTIANGTPVVINGASGQLPTVTPADADTHTAAQVIGIVTADIANGAQGHATISGVVRAFDTSAFSDGATLYVSNTAGALTATAPTSGAVIAVGTVAYSHATQGKILVSVNDAKAYLPLSGGTITGNLTIGSLFFDYASTMIGIGTLTPAKSLDIQGAFDGGVYTTGAILSSGTNANLSQARVLNNSTDANPEAGILLQAGSASATQWLISAKKTGTNIGELLIRSRTGGATSAEILKLDSSGNASFDSGTFYIDGTNNRVYVGATTATALPSSVTPAFQIKGTTNSTASSLNVRSSSDTTGFSVFFAKDRSGAAAGSADSLGLIRGYGYDGTAYVESVRLRMMTDGTVSTGVVPGKFMLSTASAAGTLTDQMIVDAGGNALVIGAGGLGYGTGSGGTVTQATSRTTGVTINKTNGAITLVSAVGSPLWQSFTVTNSTVAATDVIRVVQKSGTDKYMIFVTAVAAGSFQITFATTGGTTTEQPVFNFAITKAVTS